MLIWIHRIQRRMKASPERLECEKSWVTNSYNKMKIKEWICRLQRRNFDICIAKISCKSAKNTHNQARVSYLPHISQPFSPYLIYPLWNQNATQSVQTIFHRHNNATTQVWCKWNSSTVQMKDTRKNTSADWSVVVIGFFHFDFFIRYSSLYERDQCFPFKQMILLVVIVIQLDLFIYCAIVPIICDI